MCSYAKGEGAVSACRKFKPFQADLSVCDTCGNLGSDHETSVSDRMVLDAMWRTMLFHGGIHSYYSGGPELDGHKTREWRDHMAGCSFNWKKTSVVVMTMVGSFDGTDHDSSYEECLSGYMSCACGEYWQEDIILPGKTRGQMIWLVAHIDD